MQLLRPAIGRGREQTLSTGLAAAASGCQQAGWARGGVVDAFR